MAIFASTTTSGYSDPLKALSIKALEQRLKDQQAQMAQQQPDAAMMATIPGGIGHVLGQVGDRMQQARGEQALAAQRGELAKVMSGYDVASGAPPPAAIASLDPALYKDMVQTWAENRRAQQQNETQKYGYDSTAATGRAGHEVTRSGNQLQADVSREGHGNQAAIETARIEAQRAAAAEKVRTDALAKEEEEKRIQSRPTDEPFVVLKRALERGEINQQEFDARARHLTAPKTADQKFITEQQVESVNNQSTLKTLDEADALLNSPKGIHAGKMAGVTTTAGQWLPDKLTGIDPEIQQNTQRFNKIMGGQALQQLTQMKGASSDKDVAVNFAIVNDPNETPDNKRKALGVLREKLAYYVKINNDAIAGAGGTAPNLSAGTGGGATPRTPEDMEASRANARRAIESGKYTRQQAIDKLRAAGVDPTGL